MPVLYQAFNMLYPNVSFIRLTIKNIFLLLIVIQISPIPPPPLLPFSQPLPPTPGQYISSLVSIFIVPVSQMRTSRFRRVQSLPRITCLGGVELRVEILHRGGMAGKDESHDGRLFVVPLE